MRSTQAMGQYGERVARRFLERLGLRVLDQNWRGRDGELDIVAADGRDVVLVEVKTRRGIECGHPAEAVDARKLARIGRLGAQWLSEHRVSCCDIRIDVVAVTIPVVGAPLIEHLVGVTS